MRSISVNTNNVGNVHHDPMGFALNIVLVSYNQSRCVFISLLDLMDND